MHTRRFVLAANWKLNKFPEDVSAFFRDFLQAVEALPSRTKTAEVVIFPPSLLAGAMQTEFKNLQNSAAYPFFSLNWGGQNCYLKGAGAFTGENSAETLAHMGARFVLIGHSERRTLFHEGNEFLSQKMVFAQTAGLTPMLCIGETLEERKLGRTQDVLRTQLTASLQAVDLQKLFYVAYEPVWAIGTGVVASEQQVAEAHAWVREILQGLTPKTPQGPLHAAFEASEIPILYGGSVNLENHKALRAIPNVDGFLVGGASLKGQSFAQLLSAL